MQLERNANAQLHMQLTPKCPCYSGFTRVNLKKNFTSQNNLLLFTTYEIFMHSSILVINI